MSVVINYQILIRDYMRIELGSMTERVLYVVP
jgi:hypothetical protein